MAVPWAMLESGLVDDAPLGDPRHYSAVRSALDPYQALGLGADATVEEVQRAYKQLALKHHPDRGGDKDEFQRVSAAHDALVGRSSSLLPYGGALCPSRSQASAAAVTRLHLLAHR